MVPELKKKILQILRHLNVSTNLKKNNKKTITCVHTPTGQVLRWHFRIMVQPSAMRGAVLKPNSSAPSKAAITTSLPVI